MPLEFIGYVGNYNASETIPRSGPVVDKRHIAAAAAVHENGGFDQVLLAFNANSPESILVGQYITSITDRLKVLIAHRPGFNAPTIVARQFATLDNLSGGRVGINVITGGDDRELAQDGDHTTKDERYARTDEYLDIIRREWESDRPFDYAGRFYRVENAYSDVKPLTPGGIPLFVAGSSDPAIAVAGKHADVYALWGEPVAQVREVVSRVRTAAAVHGRSPRFSLSLRPILAETEEAAWAKADAILARARALQQAGPHDREHNLRSRRPAGELPPNEGSRRLLAAAAQGERLDKRLWTGIAALTRANGNSTSLVGTPDQVAESLLDYYDAGITTFLIRGFDPIEDAFLYGRDLLPRVRALVADRRARRVA